MNITKNENKVRWLFLDLNSFFASCEQQEQPHLRGKPVIVVPVMTDSTCAIAVSYEARVFGIKTGTRVYDAKKMCPDLITVKARHKIYVDYHHRILKVIDTCTPVTKIMSIDEVACRLTDYEGDVGIARALALKIKQTIHRDIGERLTCSIGLAPNIFLSKIASTMQKPNGLTIITRKDLPDILFSLKLQGLYGIGPRMEERLQRSGISTVRQLMATSGSQMRQIWGGVHGALYHQWLQGADVQSPASPFMHSISHQHVLEPELRNPDGARQFAQHLLIKASERLRHKDYFCRRIGIGLRWEKDYGSWWNETRFQETQDTSFLLAQMMRLCKTMPLLRPKRITIVLMGLTPASRHQPDLFSHNPRQAKLMPLIDTINRRYGRNMLGFGKTDTKVRAFTGHAAFQRVPEIFEL